MKKYLLIILILGLILVSGCGKNINNRNNKYDQETLRAFKEDGSVAIVLVRVEGSIDKITSDFTEPDFRELHKFEEDFSIKVTKKGFEKLLSNPQVKEIIAISPKRERTQIKLFISKEIEIDKINSLAFDGKYLWGVSSSNILSKINIASEEIISSCNLPFEAKGVTFHNKNIWVTSHRSLGSGEIYKINQNKCINNEQCTKENGCIVTSWDIKGSRYPKGITSDGDYFYILEQNYKIEHIHQVILKFDSNGNFVNYFIAPNEILGDITWDGKYFWIVGSNGYGCAGWCGSLPSDYFKIYQYDKGFNLISESNKFERKTLDHFGITYNGNNLWVSDRYNDKIFQISILGNEK